jgi:hypothetical protein
LTLTRRSIMIRLALCLGLFGFPTGRALGQVATPDLLEQARVAYNQERYGDAIRLATDARRQIALAVPATVVFARAHLEQFRRSNDPASLVAAREALRGVDAAKLPARDRVELLIALGESLYLDDEHSLDDRFSAAAEQFEVALGQADTLDEHSRDLLFDWWAGSIDRQAQQGPETDRAALYGRVLTRATDELDRNPSAAAASYWLAAAARGTGDLPRAVGAAMAGWVRAGALGERGLELRVDLDRLMLQVILPERARELASEADPRPTLQLLETQWMQTKQKWAR